MSATNRGAIRLEHDFYSTPEWCVRAISDHIDWSKIRQACEPCVGDGAVIRGCPDGVDWKTFEIRDGLDYLDQPTPPMVALTLTNPPFLLATDFVKKSLTHSLCVIYLLRISYLESQDRKVFLSANRPTHLHVLSKRPSFVDICAGFLKSDKKGCGWAFHKDAEVKKCPNCGGKVKSGTDAAGYAWVSWDKFEIIKDKPGIYFL